MLLSKVLQNYNFFRWRPSVCSWRVANCLLIVLTLSLNLLLYHEELKVIGRSYYVLFLYAAVLVHVSLVCCPDIVY